MSKAVRYAVFAAGVGSIMTQLLLLREFLASFGGNELIIALVLGLWLLFTGSGARFISFRPTHTRMVIALSLLSIAPLACILIIRTVPYLIYPPGASPGIAGIGLLAVLCLVPYCLLSGALLTAFARLLRHRDPTGKVYLFDTLGDLAGGFLFSLVLLHFLQPFQIVFVIIFVSLSGAYALAHVSCPSSLRYIPLLMLLLLVFLPIQQLADMTLELRYPGQEIRESVHSPYGHQVVTRYANETHLYTNRQPLTSDPQAAKETAHFPMLQRPGAQDVLLVSGGSDVLRELNTYPANIDYAQIDPALINLTRTYTDVLDTVNVTTINTDARLHLKEAHKSYDIIILDLPCPTSAELNRYYSKEFFEEAKQALRPAGVISLSVTPTQEYLARNTLLFNSVIHNTLDAVFNHTIILPGRENYLLASRHPLSKNISGLLSDHPGSPALKEGYFAHELTPRRIGQLEDSLMNTSLNHDFRPLSYYYFLNQWLHEYQLSYTAIFAALLIIGLPPLLLHQRLSYALFTTGFSAISLQFVIILGYQVAFGAVYEKLSLIITLFMAGMATGTLLMLRLQPQRSYRPLIYAETAIIASAFLLPLLLSYGPANPALMLVATFLLAAIMGTEFPLITRLDRHPAKKTSGAFFGSELVGSAIGILVTSVIALPLLGLLWTCLLIGGLNLTSLIRLCLR